MLEEPQYSLELLSMAITKKESESLKVKAASAFMPLHREVYLDTLAAWELPPAVTGNLTDIKDHKL